MPGAAARSLLEMSGSTADFFARTLSVNHVGRAQGRASSGTMLQRNIPGSNCMTFAGRLSVITAYLAMAFVGAIVLGMI